MTDSGNNAAELLTEMKRLRQELSLAEEGLANYAQEVERLRDAVFRYACHCGRQGREISLHATWCPYRIACTPRPTGED